MKPYRISGRVIDQQSCRAIAGLRVEAWDKDKQWQDLVGSADTDDTGYFLMEFDPAYFEKLFRGQQPDLYFKVYNEDALLKSTENSVLWNASTGAVTIPLTLDSPLQVLNARNVQFLPINRDDLFKLRPELYDPILLRPCTVKILMVTDDFLHFGAGDFGLSELVRVMTNESPGFWVRFQVTKAHRGADSNANLQFFQFTADVLRQYDQVWLFGSLRSRPPYNGKLSDPELRALAEFMDRGGGVFATGDHEDLGAAMGGWVPRVRNMRKWFYPGAGPMGEPVAPVGTPGQPNLQNRYDTNRQGHDPGYQFDDQSDDVPQEIAPRYYSARLSALRETIYPHPVLCGPRGAIKVLPDHAHEGECYVPANLESEINLAGYNAPEYRTLSDGSILAPEVIATATVIGGHTTTFPDGTAKPPTVGRTFGVLGAYDGHRIESANIGRIVVDSTWHHFININLIGTPGGLTAIKRQGFNATPAGRAVYEDIKAYFHNTAVWLAPKAKQECMMRRALWNSRWLYPLVEELPRLESREAIAKLSPDVLFLIGTVARDALGRLAPRCQSTRWLFDIIIPRLQERFRFPIPLPDPWAPVNKQEVLASPVLGGQQVLDAILGSMVLAIAAEFPEKNVQVLEKVDLVLEELLPQAALTGAEVAQTYLKRACEIR